MTKTSPTLAERVRAFAQRAGEIDSTHRRLRDEEINREYQPLRKELEETAGPEITEKVRGVLPTGYDFFLEIKPVRISDFPIGFRVAITIYGPGHTAPPDGVARNAYYDAKITNILEKYGLLDVPSFVSYDPSPASPPPELVSRPRTI